MSTPLARQLRRRIALAGPISVADYMAEALGHPEHGYYMRGGPFGRPGDFITAPEISQMFGELLGLWCVACWQQMGAPGSTRLVELGPGRGTLMADALRAARQCPAFRDAITVHLVESSPVLVAAQRDTLARQAPEMAARTDWHATLDEIPEGPLLLLANEFFDALPIHQFERTEAGWRERLITVDEAGFQFVLARQASPHEVLLPPASRDAPAGAVAETCPVGIDIAGAIGRRIASATGAALIVDYGPRESGLGDSFQAVRRHRAQDVLKDPGDADLTAHVDFETLARAAAQAGARCHGPLPQGQFLRRLGIDARAAALADGATANTAADIGAAHRRLIDAAEMGTLFKALALNHPNQPAPPGFEENIA